MIIICMLKSDSSRKPQQMREDMMSRRSDNQHALVMFQGEESWMQVKRIALWTKSRRAHCVFD